mmetsp:Transcript_19247/g.53660  ORF Transcript_19247/g.53660 Transcript_19247/m.53660 type:complete len:337 (-) Transcript_19247:28-1038(-)
MAMAMAIVIVAVMVVVVVVMVVVVVVVVAGRPHRLPKRPGPGPPPLPHPPLPLPIVLERRGPGLSKERPDPPGTPPNVDFAKVAPATDAKGVAVGLSGNGPGNHGFSDPGTPVQQNAPGKLRPQNDKARRIPEVGNNLSDLGEYGVESRHVVEGDSGACACAFVVVVVQELGREKVLPVEVSCLESLEHSIGKGEVEKGEGGQQGRRRPVPERVGKRGNLLAAPLGEEFHQIRLESLALGGQRRFLPAADADAAADAAVVVVAIMDVAAVVGRHSHQNVRRPNEGLLHETSFRGGLEPSEGGRVGVRVVGTLEQSDQCGAKGAAELGQTGAARCCG